MLMLMLVAAPIVDKQDWRYFRRSLANGRIYRQVDKFFSNLYVMMV